MFILENSDIILAEILLFGIAWEIGKGIFETFQDLFTSWKRKNTI